MKLILINGPAGSGKDTIGKALSETIKDQHSILIEKLAYPIKRAVAAAFDMTPEQYTYFFESPAKNEEQPFFFMKTPRQVLTDFSEIYIKPRLGHQTFAELLCRRLDKQSDIDVCIVTDCGFEDEYQHLAKQYGERNVVVLRLFRDGCDFKGDSRNYITDTFTDCAGIIDVNNNSTVESCVSTLLTILDEWLNKGLPQCQE